ncbi:class II fructose-bisphosphate aldolase [bacterium]|nr:class II fructose-bisphosphate aldolase [bacterium]
MPLVNATPILQAALRGRYAIGAFNAHNMEFVQGIIRAAEDLSAPVILQVSARAIHYAGLRSMASMVRAAAQEARVPVAMHLDHGDFDLNLKSLVAGFTSLMFDGSALPFAVNVEETRRIVEAAHVMGIPVEGELGHSGGKPNDVVGNASDYTDPDAAERFVTLTGVDSLAVTVGAIPKLLEKRPQLDIERISAIRHATGVPLVLHHSSSIPDDEVREAVAQGICKISVASELNRAFTDALRQAAAKDPDQIDPRPMLGAGRAAISEVVRGKIRLFGSAGKADEVAAGALSAR